MEAIQEEQQQQEQQQPLTGIPCPKCNKIFSNEVGLRMHNLRKHTPGRGWDTGANFNKNKNKKRKGKPWLPGQLERFQKTMRARARRKAKGIQIVYPTPEKTSVHLQHTNHTVNVLTMKYCPNCGEHLSKWRQH